jgi:N-acetylglutamate synthase-like GNAT family acetyltransferase
MNIETLKFSDLPLISALQPEGWDIMSTIAFYTKSEYCFPIKVSIDNRIAGIGTTILHHDVAWLAHIIVHPDFRNRGIGKFITESLVETAKANHCDTIYLLATELGEPVYKKIGFEAETEYLSFKGEKINEEFTKTENKVAFQSGFVQQTSMLDRRVSGEDRMFHLDPQLSESFVYLEDNTVLGYYLPAFGDGLIIANSDSAGEALMRLRLTTRDFAVFPMENIRAKALMHELHFELFRTQKRMRLGKKRDWQPANIYNRIGGNLG